MKSILRTLPLLLASASLSTAAMAATPLQSTVSANPAAQTTSALTASVASGSATNTVTGSLAGGTVNVAKFDTANGILVGATVAVNTAVTATAQVTGTVKPSGGGRTVTSDATMTGTITAAGVSFSTASPLTASRSCSGGNCANSPSNQSTSVAGSIVGSTAVSLANLSAYAGAGTIGFTRSASGSAKVTTGSGALTGSALGLYTFGDAVATNNVYSITYDFLNFANPSFNGASNVTDLTLDFGTLFQNSGPVTLNFSLYNIGNVNSAGLSLLAVNRTSNDFNFTTTASSFVNGLDGGNSLNYSLTFDPIALGLGSEDFALILQDYAAGGIGTKLYTLGLHARAAVIEPTVTVPEPATWAMMILGLGLVGVARRRSRGTRSLVA